MHSLTQCMESGHWPELGKPQGKGFITLLFGFKASAGYLVAGLLTPKQIQTLTSP